MVMQTLTDVDVDVEAIFDELECISRQPNPHDGKPFAWMEYHECYQGWLCRRHFDMWVEHTSPRNRRVADANNGRVLCVFCKKWMPLSDLAKVTVI